MNYLTPLLEPLLGVLGAVITILGSYLIVKARMYVVSRTTLQEREAMKDWIKAGVRSAEQIFGSGQGEIKKKYVLNLLQSKCISGKCDLSKEAINALIESEVQKLKGEIK